MLQLPQVILLHPSIFTAPTVHPGQGRMSAADMASVRAAPRRAGASARDSVVEVPTTTRRANSDRKAPATSEKLDSPATAWTPARRLSLSASLHVSGRWLSCVFQERVSCQA